MTEDFMSPMDAVTALRLGSYQADLAEDNRMAWFACPIPLWRAVAEELARLQAKDKT